MTVTVIYMLAAWAITWRLTRLVVRDKISEPAKNLILSVTAHIAGPRLANWGAILLSCPWCIGLWISLATHAAIFALIDGDWGSTRLILWLASALASNGLYGAITSISAAMMTESAGGPGVDVPATAQLGASMIITGSGFKPSEPVRVGLYEIVVYDDVRADQDGSLHAEIGVPDRMIPGDSAVRVDTPAASQVYPITVVGDA